MTSFNIISTHTHTCTNTKCFLWLLLPLLPRKSPPRYANALLFSFLSVRVGILDGDFEHQSRALSTIPIVSFLKPRRQKRLFLRGWWEEYFDASFDMRRRERKCGVAFARIDTSRARGSRVWWEISSSKHRVSRRKSAVFEFVIDIQSQSGPLSRYLWFRSEKFYYFDDDDADTYVLSLSSLRDNFKQVNFKTSKRVATKARAGFSVNAAAVRFSSSISCFG